MFGPRIEFIKRAVKRDKMIDLTRMLSLFCHEFNKFNNTGARMLDIIYFYQNTRYTELSVLYE